MALPNENTRPALEAARSASASGCPVKSAFAGDPDMMELIQEFAAEMPEKARVLQELWQQGNRAELKRLAHQLKGAGGGCGFEALGACAGRLEAILGEQGADAERLRERVEELVDMCQRVRA